MRKFLLALAIAGAVACGKEQPLATVNQPKPQELPFVVGSLATTDTVHVGYSIEEYPMLATRSKMKFSVFIREGSVDTDVTISVRWRIGDTPFTRTVTIPKGYSRLNMLLDEQVPPAFAVEGDYITNVIPLSSTRYIFIY